MLEYHDREWGVSRPDDVGQFEHLLLETFQAGLSWLTILKKRDAFRQAFADFNPEIITKFDEETKLRLMQNAAIIRSRPKIDSAVNNARLFLDITKEFGSFCCFIEQFKPRKANIYKTMDEIPSQTAESVAFAGELKRRGLKFIGPVSGYAHMQSVGLVNDHVESCFRFRERNAGI